MLLALAYSWLLLRLVPAGTNQSLIQTAMGYSLLGGAGLGLILVFFFITVAVVYLRDFVNLMNLFLPRTPSLIFALTLIFLGAYALKLGLETLVRVSTLLVIPVLLLISVGIFPGFFTQDHQFPLLMLEEWRSLLHGAIIQGSVFGEVLVITVFLPFTQKSRRSFWFIAIPLGIAWGIISLMTYALYSNYNNLSPQLSYKLLSLYQNIGRIESLFLFLWVTTFLIKVTIFLYGTVQGLSQVFKLSRGEPLIFPAALLIGVLSLISFDNQIDYNLFIIYNFPLFSLAVQVGIPLMFQALKLVAAPSTANNP